MFVGQYLTHAKYTHPGMLVNSRWMKYLCGEHIRVRWMRMRGIMSVHRRCRVQALVNPLAVDAGE